MFNSSCLIGAIQFLIYDTQIKFLLRGFVDTKFVDIEPRNSPATGAILLILILKEIYRNQTKLEVSKKP